MPTIVLTQPITSGGIPGTILTNIDVPYNVTTPVDACPCGFNMSVKWLYTLMDHTDETVVSGEIRAQHSFGSRVDWNWYGIIGDLSTMKHKVEVGLIPLGGGLNNLELQITNNDTGGQDWTANVVRIQLLGA
jgi:hypothetical protein